MPPPPVALAEEATSDFSPLPPLHVAGEQGFLPPYPVAGRDSAARQPARL